MAALTMDCIGVGPGPPRNLTPDPFYVQAITDNPPTAVAQVRYQNLESVSKDVIVGSPTKGPITVTIPPGTQQTTQNIPTGKRPAITLGVGPWGFVIPDWTISAR